MPQPQDLLTDVDLEKLNSILDRCARTGHNIDRCLKAHLDVDKEKRLNDEQRLIATALKREFFPNAK